MNDMLPVGSKVKLKDGRILVIIGYLPNKPNDAVLYDYICCWNIYGVRHKKEDIVLNRDYFYVNEEDISDILYIGYSDNDFDAFSYYANLVKKDLKKLREDNKEITQEDIEKLYSKIFENTIGKPGENKNEK